jgi:hypothetical protein
VGRSRGRGKSEVEHLRGEIRALQKEIKYLRRREHIEHIIIDEPVENVNARKCPDCRDGILRKLDLIYIKMEVCSNCEYKKKL